MARNIYSLFLLSFFLLSSQLRAQYSGDSFASALKSKTAEIVYVHAGVEGFASTDASGSSSGLLVELMESFEKYVFNKYGINVKSKYLSVADNDFNKYLETVKNSENGVFGLSNTSIKEERKSVFSFSPAFLNNISVLISNKSFSALNNMQEIGTVFKGKVGYAVSGTTNHSRMIGVQKKYFNSMNIKSVNSSLEIVENVIKDPNGYGFVDIHYYLDCLNRGESIKRHSVGDKMGDKFGIIMPKGSDWQPIISEFFNSGYLDSPEYRQVVSNSLGKGALRMLDL